MERISFEHPESFWLFWLLPLAGLVYFIYNRWHNNARKKIGNPVLVKTLMKGYAPRRRHFRFFLLIVILSLSILTLAGPRVQGPGQPDVRTGIDLVLALDVSKSMLAADLQPNRLEHAKNLLNSVLEKRPNDRIGLVLFAGHAYTQLPLTYDHSSADLFIKNADPAAFSAQGTAIGDALAQSRQLLLSETRRFRVILLLTDGETFDEDVEKGNALYLAEECKASGIMVITVGLGSVDGTTIIDPKTGTAKKDRSGNVVRSALNEGLLEEIAVRTKGSFVLYRNQELAQNQILEKLSNVKQTALVDQALLSFDSRYLWLAIPLALLLAIDLFIPERKKKMS